MISFFLRSDIEVLEFLLSNTILVDSPIHVTIVIQSYIYQVLLTLRRSDFLLDFDMVCQSVVTSCLSQYSPMLILIIVSDLEFS